MRQGSPLEGPLAVLNNLVAERAWRCICAGSKKTAKFFGHRISASLAKNCVFKLLIVKTPWQRCRRRPIFDNIWICRNFLSIVEWEVHLMWFRYQDRLFTIHSWWSWYRSKGLPIRRFKVLLRKVSNFWPLFEECKDVISLSHEKQRP